MATWLLDKAQKFCGTISSSANINEGHNPWHTRYKHLFGCILWSNYVFFKVWATLRFTLIIWCPFYFTYLVKLTHSLYLDHAIKNCSDTLRSYLSCIEPQNQICERRIWDDIGYQFGLFQSSNFFFIPIEIEFFSQPEKSR